jgi:two-component system KDP operon response regulator KdpE
MSSQWNLVGTFSRARDKSSEAIAPATVSSGIIQTGDFSIDLTLRTVTVRGDQIDVTSEEFDALVFLANHPQSMITRRTLLTTTWTGDRVRQTDFLRVLVSLRAKLDAAAGPGKHYLRTEPLVVYRFDPSAVSTI